MSFLSNLFGKKEDTVIGIDLGSSAIKVVQLSRKKGKAVLDTYGALALGPYAGTEIGRATNLSSGKLVEALTDILGEAKITTKIGGVAIPFSSSLMTVIELPKASEANLDNIIPLEAKKYIPVPIPEVSLDWSIIPHDEVKHGSQGASSDSPELANDERKGKIQVLIVAIHNDVIRKFNDIVSSASLQSNFFEIEIFSTIRAVLDQDRGPTMIMDIGAASTKLYVVERGNVKSSHTINRGSQDVTKTVARSMGITMKEAEILKRTTGLDARENKDLYDSMFLILDHIFAESNRVIREYREKNRRDLAKVILVGGGSSMKGFAESAEANLQASVSAGDPFSKVEAPAFVSEVLRNSGPEFAVAVGAALRGLSMEG